MRSLVYDGIGGYAASGGITPIPGNVGDFLVMLTWSSNGETVPSGWTPIGFSPTVSSQTYAAAWRIKTGSEPSIAAGWNATIVAYTGPTGAPTQTSGNAPLASAQIGYVLPTTFNGGWIIEGFYTQGANSNLALNAGITQDAKYYDNQGPDLTIVFGHSATPIVGAFQAELTSSSTTFTGWGFALSFARGTRLTMLV